MEVIGGVMGGRNRIRSPAEEEGYLHTLKQVNQSFYSVPIRFLQGQRNHWRYHDREDQAAIDTSLKFYRLQYRDAKRKGLLEERPGLDPLK